FLREVHYNHRLAVRLPVQAVGSLCGQLFIPTCSPSSEGGVMLERRLFNVFLCAGGLLVLFGGAVRDAEAQSALITGKVTGRQGDALGGATVLIDQFGTAVGTTTAGVYTLTVPPEQTKGQTVTLRARYIGYTPGTRQITLTPGTQTQDFDLKFD